MAIELGLRGIPFLCQHEIDIEYKGRPVATHRLDLLVHDRLIVELKAVERIAPVHVTQTLSYLTACGLELGLIINFNVSSLSAGGIRRVIRSLYPE